MKTLGSIGKRLGISCGRSFMRLHDLTFSDVLHE